MGRFVLLGIERLQITMFLKKAYIRGMCHGLAEKRVEYLKVDGVFRQERTIYLFRNLSRQILTTSSSVMMGEKMASYSLSILNDLRQ